MEHRPKIGLDNPALRGRLRAPRKTVVYDRPHARKQHIDNFHTLPARQHVPVAAAPKPQTVSRAFVLPKASSHSSRLTYAEVKKPGLPRQSRSNVLKRNTVRVKSKKFQPIKYRRQLMPTVMSGMAIFLFLFGVLTLVNSIRTDKSVQAQVKGIASKSDDDGMTTGVPNEDAPPSDISGYRVAADMPRFFSIEKLNVHARVRSLGVGANNMLKAPLNIFDVGWYDASAKPGENGTVVLDGHVSGPTKRGVFYEIGSLKEGDKVSLERGDGKTFTYTVTGTKVYDNDKVDMARLMTTSVPGKPALNFITCTGRFNIRTNQYEQRVVVFAVQDPS